MYSQKYSLTNISHLWVQGPHMGSQNISVHNFAFGKQLDLEKPANEQPKPANSCFSALWKYAHVGMCNDVL